MLLAVDIGNSTISTGLFGLDGELRFLASLDTDYRKTADQICVDLMNLFQLYHFRYEDVTDSILCSVVPPLNFMMEKALTRLLGKPPVVVGPGVKTGLNIRLAVQSQVGADIVADAVSALEQFTAPIITIENAAYCNWPEATSEAFAARGCTLAFKAVHDSPLEGGAIPVGPHDLVLCTRRFARYYEDLDVEDVCELDIRGFEPIIYPFLVYRHDTSSVVARQAIEAMG